MLWCTCNVVAGWSLASHTRPLLHIRHPSRTREECADGELTLVENCQFVEAHTDFKWAQCKSKFCLHLFFFFFFLQFELFYNQHFSGRKLTWLHYLCTGSRKHTTHTVYMKMWLQLKIHRFGCIRIVIVNKKTVSHPGRFNNGRKTRYKNYV